MARERRKWWGIRERRLGRWGIFSISAQPHFQLPFSCRFPSDLFIWNFNCFSPQKTTCGFFSNHKHQQMNLSLELGILTVSCKLNSWMSLQLPQEIDLDQCQPNSDWHTTYRVHHHTSYHCSKNMAYPVRRSRSKSDVWTFVPFLMLVVVSARSATNREPLKARRTKLKTRKKRGRTLMTIPTMMRMYTPTYL